MDAGQITCDFLAIEKENRYLYNTDVVLGFLLAFNRNIDTPAPTILNWLRFIRIYDTKFVSILGVDKW